MASDERDQRDEGSLLVEGQAGATARDVDQPVISLRDVHLAYDRPILQGVSFDLCRVASQRNAAAALPTFNESTSDAIGMATNSSHAFNTSGLIP